MPHIVDNRCFVVGLNEMYRDAMRRHEASVLLPHAEVVLNALGLEPVSVPVEGYYAQSAELARYFLIIRTLQEVTEPPCLEGKVADALDVLCRVFRSPAMGRQPTGQANRSLLPRTGSPLNEALETTEGWDVKTIAARSHASVRDDDAGLIAVAAASGDAVALCATRETMVLEAALVADAEEPLPSFEWQVAPEVVDVALRFAAALQEATGLHVPPPGPESAEVYWNWASMGQLSGRCVAMAVLPQGEHPWYHWYIAENEGNLEVVDFWSSALWTTAAMTVLPAGDRPARGSRTGSPPVTPPQISATETVPNRRWWPFGRTRRAR